MAGIDEPSCHEFSSTDENLEGNINHKIPLPKGL